MKPTCILALSLACAFPAYALVDAPAVHSIDQKLQEKLKFLNPEYLVLSPNADPGTKLPLLIYLHGAGGRGKDIAKVRGQVMGVWRGIQKFRKSPCIVVAPQCLRTAKDGLHSTWTAEDLDVLLQHLKATLPIDHTRIYLTGNSMGGYGTWAWGAHSPQHFAAIAPISGGTGRGGPKDVTPDLAKWAETLARIP
ncbi:MAG: alpha/beta fold hydrolase, partial [Phycisphaerae bacterium]|nr:alpha/beta fold hydrolase [Phycisphaerae bacterium]